MIIINKLFNILRCLSYFLAILIVYLLIISIFNYFEILSYKVVSIINYIFVILLFTFSGFKLSRYERKKGYLNGFLMSLVLLFIFCIIALITSKLSFSSLVYYLTLILSSIVGGIIGVPNKNE